MELWNLQFSRFFFLCMYEGDSCDQCRVWSKLLLLVLGDGLHSTKLLYCFSDVSQSFSHLYSICVWRVFYESNDVKSILRFFVECLACVATFSLCEMSWCTGSHSIVICLLMLCDMWGMWNWVKIFAMIKFVL